MAVVIAPRWAYKKQVDMYPAKQWYWRGIVDPMIFDVVGP